MRAVLAGVAFLGAFLVIAIQPAIAVRLSPAIGGSAYTWVAIQCVFQGLLLGGYVAISHLSGRWRSRRVVLGAVLLLAAAYAWCIPIESLTVASDLDGGAAVLFVLVSVGPVFACLCMLSIAVQVVATALGDVRPGWLYAVSSVGSLVAVFGYAFLVEPNVDVSWQLRVWRISAGALLIVSGASVVTFRTDRNVIDRSNSGLAPPAASTAAWTAGGFVPVTLSLGCTYLLSLEFGSHPCVWLGPFGVYLITMALAFVESGANILRVASKATPLAMVVLVYSLMQPWTTGFYTFGLHVALLGVLLSSWHTWLVSQRPPARHLPRFYAAVALGGLLASATSYLSAPSLLNPEAYGNRLSAIGTTLFGTLAPEYLLGSFATAFILPGFAGSVGPLAGRLGEAACLGAVAFCAPFQLLERLRVSTAGRAAAGLAACIGVVLIMRIRDRLSTATCVAAVLVAAVVVSPESDIVLFHHRSVLGQVRVLERGGERILVHGTTNHGSQALNCAVGKNPVACAQPTTYYARSGPLGVTIEHVRREVGSLRFLSVGLGAGTLGAYCDRSDTIQFIELDPAVVSIARTFFGFLDSASHRCEAVDVQTGDGRTVLRGLRRDRDVDVLVMDAFSSDNMPLHLMTKEALLEGSSALSAHGLIAVNVSSRYFNVARVVMATAGRAGLASVLVRDRAPRGGRSASEWVFLAMDAVALAELQSVLRSAFEDVSAVNEPGFAASGVRGWTDERRSILSAIR